MGYMGKPGDTVYIDSQGKGEMKIFLLINSKNFSMIDMFFSSKKEARKYAKEIKLNIVKKESLDL